MTACLCGHCPKHTRATVPPAEILSRVGAAWGVDVAALRASSRAASFVEARGAAAYLLRHAAGLSLPEVGRVLHRDHSTVLSAIRRTEARLSRPGGEVLRQRVAQVCEWLGVSVPAGEERT